MSEPKKKVQQQYDRAAGVYDRRWEWYVEASIRETLRRMPPIAAGAAVLDVGCGTGALLTALAERLPAARLHGVDLSVSMVATASARRGIRRSVAADAEALPFGARTFDLVVSSSSFHYWPRPDAALAEIRRCLRPSGALVITDWCDDFLVCRICNLWLRVVDPAHRRVYRSREAIELLERAAFVDATVERYRISAAWGLMTLVARRA